MLADGNSFLVSGSPFRNTICAKIVLIDGGVPALHADGEGLVEVTGKVGGWSGVGLIRRVPERELKRVVEDVRLRPATQVSPARARGQNVWLGVPKSVKIK